ncbi:MAG: hypothetical protein KBB64_02410 [Bacteroidia bacterium]|nr:hypothetical protein [Bacteroidia bacterium]
MKSPALPILLLLFTGCISTDNKNPWSKEQSHHQVLLRENSSTWDTQMLLADLANIKGKSELPMISGVYPVPTYDLVGKGSFRGVGNFGFPGGEGSELKINDKTILYNSFFAGANPFNKAFIDGKKNEVFFQIIVLTDTVDTVNYSHVGSEVISRNHPNYIGQGYYKTKSQKIEYIAFQTADRHAFAMVNMRIFDLSLGRTILIAPQKDQSFHSKQINAQILSSEEIENFTDSLLKVPQIIQFFTQDGTI